MTNYTIEHRIPGIPWAAFARSRSLETAFTFMRALAKYGDARIVDADGNTVAMVTR